MAAPTTLERLNQMADVTVQQLHLELIRRQSSSMYSGETIVAFLLAHQELWLSVLMDTYEETNHSEPGRLIPYLGKLGYLPRNGWLPQTLWFLCPSQAAAESLYTMGRAEKVWVSRRYSPYLIFDEPMSDYMLGGGDDGWHVMVINLG